MTTLAWIVVICLVGLFLGGLLAALFMDTSDVLPLIGLILIKVCSIVGLFAMGALLLGALGVRVSLG